MSGNKLLRISLKSAFKTSIAEVLLTGKKARESKQSEKRKETH